MLVNHKTLGRLYSHLRRNHPELIGMGFGRRTTGGRITSSLSIRLVVARKLPKNRRSYRKFPRSVALQIGRGRRPVVLRVFTDVEEVGEWIPTSFPLAVNGVLEVVASCYVRWRSNDGRDHLGIVTVGHALEPIGVGGVVDVPAGNSFVKGRVVTFSRFTVDGIDVGLVEVPADHPGLPSVLPEPMNPNAASVSTALDLLGTSDTDSRNTRLELWHSKTPAVGRALAYYVERPVSRPNGGGYTLRAVVLADGPADTFAPGRSGAPWIVDASLGGTIGIAIQSHGDRARSFRNGLGTHILTALRWLAGRPSLKDFRWDWQPSMN